MPKTSCAASFCKNTRCNVKKRGLDVIFHSFPAQSGSLKDTWIQFCKRDENWLPTQNSALCSAHFKHEDYQMTNSPLVKDTKNLRRLHINAVPSILDSILIPITEKKQIDDEKRKHLLEELYCKNTDVSSRNDHTYSELESQTPKYMFIGSKTSVYRLQNFPDVCAHCLKPVDDECRFISVTEYNEILECTIEQKCDEFAGDPMEREILLDAGNLLPNKVCEECLESLITLHQYQRQLECIGKFTSGIAQLLNGNQQPLENLYRDQGMYLVDRLKRLNIYKCSDNNGSLDKLLKELSLYRQLKPYAKNNKTSPDVMVLENDPNFNERDYDGDDDGDNDDYVINTCAESDVEAYEQDVSHMMDAFEMQERNFSESNIKQEFGRRKRCMLKNQDVDSDNENATNKMSCPYENSCTETFSNELTKHQHIQEKHTSFECYMCGNVLPFYDLYQKHMESHAIARALLLSYKNREDISDISHNDDIRSDVSGDRREGDLICQNNIVATEQNYVCGTCLGVYLNEYDFKRHKCKSLDASSKASKILS